MPVMERVSQYLRTETKDNVLTASYQKNKYLRLIDFTLTCLFKRYHVVSIDVFSGNSFYVALFLGKMIRWRKGKIIGILHGGRLPEFSTQKERLTRQLFDQLDVIVSPSNFICNFYKDWGYNVQYLPNPINIDDFSFKPKIEESSSPKLLWVRAFTKIYNPFLPIKLVKQLSEQYPDIQLTMIGPNLGLLNESKELAKQLGIEKNINFLGGVPNKELYKFFHSHDIYLNTTSYESFGMAVLEAASCGIPIVSTAVGELPMLWKDKVNILFSEEVSAKAFVKPVCNLIESKDLSSRMILNARKKAENFDWEIIKQQWLVLFSNNGRNNK